jgi:hypothetical protein
LDRQLQKLFWSRSSKLVAPLMSQQYSNEIKIPSSRMDMCYTSEAKPSRSWQPLFLTWIPHVVVWKLWITKRQCWCIFLFGRNHSVSIVLVMPGRFEAERRVSLLEKTTLRLQTVSYADKTTIEIWLNLIMLISLWTTNRHL